MKPTLLILAAGMASRYGSMKQIEGFGPDGETIMDYSIYDAIRAGFDKVVFIIRKEFEKDFNEIFESKLKGKIQIDYAFQDLNDNTEGFVIPADRKKPWMACAPLQRTARGAIKRTARQRNSKIKMDPGFRRDDERGVCYVIAANTVISSRS